MTPRHRLRALIIDLSVMVAIGLVLALLGPFGSFGMPLAWRLVYWLALSLTGYFCYVPIAGVVLAQGAKLDLPVWALWLFAIVVASVPMTAIVVLVGELPGRLHVPPLEVLAEAYGSVAVIGGGIAVLFWLIDGRAQRSSVQQDVRTDTPKAQPRFIDRLPAHLGSQLFALEMEDHYVRAHTALGSDLVLLRMSDAVAELEGIDGAQVHRSWWVARDAVVDVERDGRNLSLVLPGGLVAPVARSRVAELKAAGWI